MGDNNVSVRSRMLADTTKFDVTLVIDPHQCGYASNLRDESGQQLSLPLFAFPAPPGANEIFAEWGTDPDAELTFTIWDDDLVTLDHSQETRIIFDATEPFDHSWLEIGLRAGGVLIIARDQDLSTPIRSVELERCPRGIATIEDCR